MQQCALRGSGKLEPDKPPPAPPAHIHLQQGRREGRSNDLRRRNAGHHLHRHSGQACKLGLSGRSGSGAVCTRTGRAASDLGACIVLHPILQLPLPPCPFRKASLDCLAYHRHGDGAAVGHEERGHVGPHAWDRASLKQRLHWETRVWLLRRSAGPAG